MSTFLDITKRWSSKHVDDEELNIIIEQSLLAIEKDIIANREQAENFLLPLLNKLAHDKNKELRILSIGCGVGEDVSVLVDKHYDCYGIDAGARIVCWPKMRNKRRLIVGDGKQLPFKNESFDVIIMLEVIEHIGSDDLSNLNKKEVEAARKEFISGLLNCLNKGGYVLLSSPNKNFCIDFFHKPNFLGRVRLHSPWEAMTVSYNELIRYFVKIGNCSSIESLSIEGFFHNKSARGIKKLIYKLANIYFRAINKGVYPFVPHSFLCPHLIMLIKK
ncbi:class I SAM-dependent methyltransferase [Patescibacteria group bacterium]|nr:class I SAM-dependent methyltransferase [Patescibacteria group bacterium]